MRSHEVMRSVTGRLGDEEMAALAAYFGGLTPH
jgi:cytochrome c553